MSVHVVICAELGINHNGSVEAAMNMATAAKACGCDLVKIQKRHVESCYSQEELARPCESIWGKTVEDKVRGRELSWDAVEKFACHCREIGIDWFASCFDLRSLRELHGFFPVRSWNKIPACMAVFPEFVEAIARQRLPTIVSLGFLDRLGVHSVARTFEDAGCDYLLAHCVALYPCPQDRLNVARVQFLAREFLGRAHNGQWPHCVGVGYSGHETGVLPSVVSACLGAVYIERHFTLDRAGYGADQAASLEPRGMERLVRDVRELERIMGLGEPDLRGDEKRAVTRFLADGAIQ